MYYEQTEKKKQPRREKLVKKFFMKCKQNYKSLFDVLYLCSCQL